MIYATPFKTDSKECTGPSVNSGFDTLDSVVVTMGEQYVVKYPRMVIYPASINERIIFSDDVIFQVDENNINR